MTFGRDLKEGLRVSGGIALEAEGTGAQQERGAGKEQRAVS